MATLNNPGKKKGVPVRGTLFSPESMWVAGDRDAHPIEPVPDVPDVVLAKRLLSELLKDLQENDEKHEHEPR